MRIKESEMKEMDKILICRMELPFPDVENETIHPCLRGARRLGGLGNCQSVPHNAGVETVMPRLLHCCPIKLAAGEFDLVFFSLSNFFSLLFSV